MNQPPGYDKLIADVERKIATRKADKKVDVVVNIYGKPYNTAVTLYTLRAVDRQNLLYTGAKTATQQQLRLYKGCLW